jgi:hypothetical protein
MVPLGEDSLPAIECADERRHYGETRIRAIAVIGNMTLHCIYTPREGVRRIISLRYADRRGRDAMARRTRADVDSLKGETARDKLCEDAAEALIFRDMASDVPIMF